MAQMSPLKEAPTGLPPCLWHPPWCSCTWLLTVLTPDNAFRVKRKKTPERHATLLTSRTDMDGACRPAWDEGLDVLERKPCVQSRYSHTCSSVCISKNRAGSSLGGLFQVMSPVGSPGRREDLSTWRARNT